MLNPNEIIIEKLYPMAVANYVAKLPEMQSVGQHKINQEMLDESLSFSERLERIASNLGSSAAVTELYAETDILLLTISDKEDEVMDADRNKYYAKSDITQLDHRKSQFNLEWFTDTGIVVEAQPDTDETTQLINADTNTDIPLIEQFKSARLLRINGFGSSRSMHLIHDVIDHPWLFNALTANGVFEKYYDFLDSVDLNAESFLYSRQAELVASVGFGSRRWELEKERGDQFLLESDDIVSLIRTSQDERCIQASDTFTADDSVRKQAQFVIENMAVQIADERRRYGAVKMRDQNGLMKPMPLLHPVYLAFLIDSVKVLQEIDESDKAQIQTICMVEEVLETIKGGNTGKEMRVEPSRIGNKFTTNISPKKIEWISQNKARLTTYTSVS